jgi:acetyl esterase/lipase
MGVKARLMGTMLAALGLVGVGAAGAQQTVIPLWPHGAPEPAQTTAAEANVATAAEVQKAGYPMVRLSNVTAPTMMVYPPTAANTGTAVLVFPGGAYMRLAMDIEGTDTCKWLNGIGVTCLLVKYRVPQPSGAAGHYPADVSDLEDAQQAMRLAKAHAKEWGVDPKKIGVMGFSAGGNLAVLMSTHPDDKHVEGSAAANDVDTTVDARPAFAILGYPAYLAVGPEQKELDPVYAPNGFTPPTFVVVAQDDKTYGKNSLVYYRALTEAGVPAELHAWPSGGHGFGTYPVGKPEAGWTGLAAGWLKRIGMVP